MNRIPIQRHSNQEVIEISDFETVKHLRKVLGVREGDSLKLALINEGLAESEILEVHKDRIITKIQKITPARETKIKLIVALSRPLTMQKVLEHGTTLGVSEFHFFKAELSEKSYLESKFIRESKFENYLLKGIAQAGIYAKLPAVSIYKNFSDIPLHHFQADNKLLLSLRSNHFISSESIVKKRPTTFLIGPERGLTPDEEDVFIQFDFHPIKIGESIQRVEYAVATALGQLDMFLNQG